MFADFTQVGESFGEGFLVWNTPVAIVLNRFGRRVGDRSVDAVVVFRPDVVSVDVLRESRFSWLRSVSLREVANSTLDLCPLHLGKKQEQREARASVVWGIKRQKSGKSSCKTAESSLKAV